MSSVVEATGPVKHALISAADSGANALVAAVEGKKIRVLSYMLVGGGTVTAKFASDGEVDTDLTGAMPLAANSHIHGAFNPCGHFEALAGAALLLTLSGATAVTGHLVYQEVL